MKATVSSGDECSDPFWCQSMVWSRVMCYLPFLRYIDCRVEGNWVHTTWWGVLKKQLWWWPLQSQNTQSWHQVHKKLIKELLYADDTALLSTNLIDIQRLLNTFKAASTSFGFSINVKKTQLLFSALAKYSYSGDTKSISEWRSTLYVASPTVPGQYCHRYQLYWCWSH